MALKARDRLEAEENPQRSATSAKGWRVCCFFTAVPARSMPVR